MKDQNVEASNSASVLQAGGSINISISTNYNGMPLADLLRANSPSLPPGVPEPLVSAQQQTASEFVDLVVATLAAHRPDLAQEFATPRMLAAVQRAQSAHIEAEDEDLAHNLAKLLVELADAQRRSLREGVLKQAIECVPRLSTSHVNGLAVVSILKYSVLSEPQSLEYVIRGIANDLRPFFDDIPQRISDYRYLASCGVGSIIGLYSVLDLLLEHYKYEMQNPILTAELVRAAPATLAEYVEPSAADPEKSVVRRQTIANLSHQEPDFDYKIGAMISSTKMKKEELRAQIDSIAPDLGEFFRTLERTNALHLELNAVGYAIGNLAWHAKSDDALSLDDFLAT